jgi:hypothetical protein
VLMDGCMQYRITCSTCSLQGYTQPFKAAVARGKNHSCVTQGWTGNISRQMQLPPPNTSSSNRHPIKPGVSMSTGWSRQTKRHHEPCYRSARTWTLLLLLLLLNAC